MLKFPQKQQVVLAGNKMELVSKIFNNLVKQKLYCLEFINKHKKNKNNFTRKRKLPFGLILSTILKLSKKSLHIECELLEKDSEIMPPSKQAFSSARYKFSHTGFIELLNDSLETLYKNKSELGLWRGYRFLGMDGSSLRLPESKSTIEKFGKFKCNAENTSNNPILGRVSLVTDLCTSMVVDAALENWKRGEQSIAYEQLPKVVDKLIGFGQEKLCFIYDRGYISKKFLTQHINLSVDFIFRVQKKCYAHIWDYVNKGRTDFMSDIDGHEVRVVVVPLKTGEKEVLITSLKSEEFSIVDLGNLYNMRWNIEECFKKLKVTSELENFSGIHVEAVLQDFWAHMVMCNTLTLMILDKEEPLVPSKLPKYKLNFSVILGATRHRLRDFLVNEGPIEIVYNIFNRVAKRAKVPVKPGRSFDRSKVGKPRRHQVFRRVC